MTTAASVLPIFADSSATVAGKNGTLAKPLARSTSTLNLALKTAAYGSPSLSWTSPS
ncbi:hypothetical protein OV079_25685 [Nannocystis pusilla]|uniref:Uncharacterized protein n=1 Tax=Nannocystis pusilla TaxID=889268 RepID=A0A9X3ERJ7_9BACT|nr:hypothetical protein [Nannocystis pusilla]MCY1008888.1 hypothetical protein [Nannocystis pusilla]